MFEAAFIFLKAEFGNGLHEVRAEAAQILNSREQ